MITFKTIEDKDHSNLHVHHGNPAKKLYESLGLKVVSSSDTHEYMELDPA